MTLAMYAVASKILLYPKNVWCEINFGVPKCDFCPPRPEFAKQT